MINFSIAEKIKTSIYQHKMSVTFTLCAQLTRDLLAIAEFLYVVNMLMHAVLSL